MRLIPKILPLLLGLVLAIGLGGATFFWFPKALDSREIALSKAVDSWVRSTSAPVLTASTFCEMWTGQALASVDCRSGYNMDTLTPVMSAQAQTGWAQAGQSVERRQSELRSLLKHLDALRFGQPMLTQPLFALQLRLDQWAERSAQLTAQTSTRPAERTDYVDMFQILLAQQGQSYDAASGTFKTINWHVVRAVDSPSILKARADALANYLALIPWAVTLCTAVLVALGWWRARWMGWGLMAGYAVLTWLGLFMAADASVHYGQGSSVFPLNPLGNQLNRQMLVGGISALIIAAGLLFSPWVLKAISLAMRYLGATMLGLIVLTGVAYALQGPSLGSEALKLGTAVMAGLMTAAFGRSVHATAQIAPAALTPWRLMKTWLQSTLAAHDPVDVIAAQLNRPLLQFTGFCAVGIGSAALIFHDLGAALVTAIVAVTSLYMVFGPRLAGVVLLAGILMAAVMSQTEKVQGRIALMLDPLSASVSDFARLLAFSNASHESGFSWGHIAWCSGGGVCIPVQALSDYMPVVLTGVLGARGTFVFFLLYLMVMMALAAWLMRKFLILQGNTRALSMMAFFMLWGTAAQTVVTFLGNWRIIPLTGLGTPLLSIGLSSSLVPVIALTLIMVVRHQSQGTSKS
jgi:cell division protein FtsW (lipid II flippase)